MKTTKHNLEKLIKDQKCYYVNSDITTAHFPVPKKVETENWKIIHMDKSFTSQEALDRIKAKGCRPANIYELLLWKKDHYEKEMPKGVWSAVIAFGSQWKDAGGNHRVPRVYRLSDGVWQFYLGYFESDWDAVNCLLCFCDSPLDTKTLTVPKNLDTLTLAKIKALTPVLTINIGGTMEELVMKSEVEKLLE